MFVELKKELRLNAYLKKHLKKNTFCDVAKRRIVYVLFEGLLMTHGSEY